jgi:acetoin utilization deacetylase AcuC-like enzyme
VRREERQDVILESDPGIVVTQGAYYASKAAAACAVSGVDLLNGGDNMVYSLCRPPGHHASSGKMGGYCYFNNAAIAAGMLRNAGKRVAILDIDFHHGNGTQDIFFDDDGTLYASINCIGAYPHHAGSALVDERHSAEVGADGRHNHIANFNLPSEIGETGYDAAFEAARLRIKDFKPDVLIVSAGFDTSAGERKDLEDVKPFGLTEAFYRHMGNVLGGVTIGGADLPILVVQEGGYNPAQLGRDVWSFLDGMERVRRTFTGHVRSSPRHAQIQS